MPRLDDRQFTRRVVITLGVTTLFFVALSLLWLLGPVLLALFLGVLLGVLLDGMARAVTRWTGAPHKVAAIGLALLLAAGLVGLGFLAGPSVSEQLTDLDDRLGQALGTLEDRLEPLPGGPLVLDHVRGGDALAGGMSTLRGAVSAALAGAAGGVTALVIALFGAAQPDLYRRGLLRLVPADRRERAEFVLGSVACALRNWVKGRAVGMLFVGASMWLALALLDLQPAGALALIAGLCTFVPILGPWLGAIPAAVLTLVSSPTKLAVLLLAFGGVQFLETNVVTPLAQQRAVRFPPALLITAQLVLGTLAGLPGLVVATPLAVVVIVLVQTLYIRGVLGEDIAIAGNPAEGS